MGWQDDPVVASATSWQADPVISQDAYQAALKDQQAQQMQEMGTGQRFLAGMGRGFKNLALGSAQLDLAAAPSWMQPDGLQQKLQSQVDEERKLSKPLMATPAGKAGDITANVAATLPAALIPGVNTLPGALAAGTMMGAAEPVGANDSRALNAAEGGALFAAVPAAASLLRAGKALVQPLYQSGREAIVGQTLNRFAGQDPGVLSRLQNPETFVPGSVPTAADASGNASLAMLENAATSRDPIIKDAFAKRLVGNNQARVDALKQIAGGEDQRAFYQASRDATANDLYGRAFSETPEDSAWIKGQVTTLMQRPAFVDALKQAQEIAMNQGIKVSPDNPENTTQILHYAKMALDDAATQASSSGSKNAAAGILDTRDRLVSLMESKGFSPSYREARDTYKQMSQPINQMDVGQYLYEKLQPALNDFGGTTRNRASQYAEALRNADQTASKATGFSGARLADTMSPEQMQTLGGIARDLSRRAGTEDAMRGIGSNTAQNLAAQNVLAQIVGPLGLPQSFGQNALKNIMAVPYIGPAVKWGAQGAENAVQDELAKALLDPKRAADLMAATRKTNPTLANRLQQFMLAKQSALLPANAQ